METKVKVWWSAEECDPWKVDAVVVAKDGNEMLIKMDKDSRIQCVAEMGDSMIVKVGENMSLPMAEGIRNMCAHVRLDPYDSASAEMYEFKVEFARHKSDMVVSMVDVDVKSFADARTLQEVLVRNGYAEVKINKK